MSTGVTTLIGITTAVIILLIPVAAKLFYGGFSDRKKL